MGCSSSAVSPEGEANQQSAQETAGKENHVADHKKSNGHTRALPAPHEGRKQSQEKLQKKDPSVDKNANKLNASDQTPVPKCIAFDVKFFDAEDSSTRLIKRKPARLSTLEPLNVATFTAEQLEEKQRLADEKRERIRQKKVNKSQKSSKRRRELLKAREFGLRQQMEQEKTVIDDSLKQAEIKREQRLLEVKEKQRIREERAKRARERAKKMQNPDDEIEVEKDEQFNATSDESWLDNPQAGRDDEEGVHKGVSHQSSLRPTASASTVDSYDNAFMRSNTHEKVLFDDAALGHDDDFFGS